MRKKRKMGQLLSVLVLAIGTYCFFFDGKKSAYAFSVPSGNTKIGELGGVPVIKAKTKDMSTSAFQSLVNAIIGESSAQYVVDRTYWTTNTQLSGGIPLSSMPNGQSYWLKQDGFTNADKFISLRKNGRALIRSVGYATEVSTNKKIPLDLMIVYLDSSTSNGSGTADTMYLAVKNQNSVLTFGWLAPADAGSEDVGGSSEGGGYISGGSGAMASYVNNVRFGIALINANTKQLLPANKTLMALKLSDIDVLQRATLGRKGAKGIILSPDTSLAIDGQGMVTRSTQAVTSDTKNLSASSYITIRQFNTADVQFAYTGRERDNHCDLVVGAFGQYPFTVNVKGKVIVEHRDKYNNQLLKTTQESKLIGSRYSYKPYNSLKVKGKTYLPQSTNAKSGTIKSGTNKVVFYYDLERTITVSHVDKRTNQLIVPKKTDKKRRGQTYNYSPRKDLKKGTYSYRILTPKNVSGKVGDQNLAITFYYDVPLMSVGFEREEIYTANAQKGLPLKLKIKKEWLYEKALKEYEQEQVTVQITDKNTKAVVYKKAFSLKELPENLAITIDPKFLEKGQCHTYEAQFVGLKKEVVVSKAAKIDTKGYTATEKQINVTPHEAKEIVYKGVVMTYRDYGKAIVEKNEQFRMNTVKCQAQKTGYGFKYAIKPSYENEYSLSGVKDLRFHLTVDSTLIESSLALPKKDGKVQLALETVKNETNGKKKQWEQALPEMYLEKKSGKVFSKEQKQAKDPKIKEELIDGGRKLYVPMWIDLGDYEVDLQSVVPIGVHEITVKVTDYLPIKAYLFGHFDSPSIDQDEIVFSPVDSNNPLPESLKKNFTEEELKWFKNNK
uniref:MucBP domain-containing protein n=1 Tax=Enterococcus faecalis TaxID=1351 RepID=UPI00359C6F6E